MRLLLSPAIAQTWGLQRRQVFLVFRSPYSAGRRLGGLRKAMDLFFQVGSSQLCFNLL